MSVRTRTMRVAQPPAAPRLSDVARERILEFLFDRRLSAGAFVSQNELVKLLGVPVAPLRDALRVLEVEGILKIHPRSGIEFIKPALELTRSTYQFRTIVERAAVRVFAETGQEGAIVELRRDHEVLIEGIEAQGLDARKEAETERLEDALHGAIVGSLGNQLIDASYKRMHNYLRLVRLERQWTTPIVRRSLMEHMRIIQACAARDADEAEAAVQAHFSSALQRHLGMF